MNRQLFALFKRLPTEWASALGSFIVRKSVPFTRPQIIVNAKANLRKHRPEASEAELDAMVIAFLDGVGRLMAEYAVIDRFFAEGRVSITGGADLRGVAGQRPIVAFCLHTGNWEVFCPAFQTLGIPLHTFFEPPEDPFEREIVERTRAGFGVTSFTPDHSGIRAALRALHANKLVAIFPDEARNGITMGPLFGRPPHANGNLAIAAKLARKADAALLLGHCRRIGRCHFELVLSPLFELPPVSGKPDLLADVAFLNAHIEPIISQQIPRWYFLDDSIAPLER